MGLTNEQEKAREEDANVRYLSKNICNKDGDKDFVFISYKSDDWEIVLKEIVYKLVKEYGLNVYFDGDFKDNNPHWTTQFPDNMESDKCKGVLVFLDDKYATSYATLMELMHSQFGCQDAYYNFVRKPVVPINLVKALSVINDESDTGLGQSVYFNGEKEIKNIKAPDEQALFDDDFDIGCEKNVIKKTKKSYLKNKKLSKKLCSFMVGEVLESIDYNDNFYDGNLDGIVNSIRNACGGTVFCGKREVTKHNVVVVNVENKKSIQVNEGALVPAQDAGIRAGFEFEGWFVSNTDEEWDFSNPVHEDMEICAKWETIIPNSTETKSPVKVEIQPDGKIYRITGNRSSYDAFYRIGEEGKITILRGSRIRINETYIPNKLLKQYEGMITQEGYLLCDIEELSRSTAAKVIEGVSTNGQELLDEKKLLNREVVVSLNTLGGDSDNDVIIERKSINEDTTLEVGHNIGDKIIGPIGLGGLHSDGEVPSKKSKTKKLSLEEMVKNNIVSVDDAVYVKGMEGEVGFLTLDGRVLYKNETISLNQYVLKVLGPGSRNAYTFVYHKKTGKLLDELR